MTINVALVTSEAIVLGCDSIASSAKYYIDPFATAIRDANGNLVRDAKGKMSSTYSFSDMENLVTDYWDGVTKMFRLHGEKDKKVTHVAAITTGMATLNDQTMASLANEFLARTARRERRPRVQVSVIVNEFLAFMRREYLEHHKKSQLPQQLWEDAEFLVGGYGRDDNFPSLYRVSLKNNTATAAYVNGKFGAAWGGQADSVQRLLFGYDEPVKAYVEKVISETIDRLHGDMSQATLRILGDTLNALNQQLPAGVDTTLPGKPTIAIPWTSFAVGIDFTNMPTQDAVNFVAYLVYLQSGKAKFVRGIATVGGRIHIGVITKSKGFEMINEPEITHENTGFGRA